MAYEIKVTEQDNKTSRGGWSNLSLILLDLTLKCLGIKTTSHSQRLVVVIAGVFLVRGLHLLPNGPKYVLAIGGPPLPDLT